MSAAAVSSRMVQREPMTARAPARKKLPVSPMQSLAAP
jgi:hypothetical protein